MRWFYLAIFVLIAAAIVIFAAQNFQIVEVSFLRVSFEVPLAFLIAIIYLLGAATGGSLLAVLRQAIEGARSRRRVSTY